MTAIRFAVEPRDVPPLKAARRLGLTEAQFDEFKEDYFRRGFPRPDPTSGLYDLKAVDAWMDRRSGLTTTSIGRDVSPTEFKSRLEALVQRGGRKAHV